MVMKASIFSQTHTEPSDPPRPAHNGPPSLGPTTCWIFPGKGGRGEKSSFRPAPSPTCTLILGVRRLERPCPGLPTILSSRHPPFPHLRDGGDGPESQCGGEDATGNGGDRPSADTWRVSSMTSCPSSPPLPAGPDRVQHVASSSQCVPTTPRGWRC